MAEAEKPLSGVLKIDIADPALKVVLTFEASNDGDEWTPATLGAALAERGIENVPGQAVLAEFLKTAAASAGKGPVSAEVATGIAPVQPAPETPLWEDLPVPEDLRQISSDVLAQTPPPVIVRTIREPVERETTVTQKSGFPFGKERVEKKIVRDTVERQERVYIDPSVKELFFARQGDLVGRITPASAGIPGRDVFGRPLPIRKLADPAFHCGPNLQKIRDEIRAGQSGFVRAGQNWADLIPFSEHSWSVELSPDKATAFLLFTPGHRALPLPDPEEILQAARELPYPEESLIQAREILQILTDQTEAGTEERVVISSSRDASFDIYVPEDKLSAYLNVHKGKGRGRPLNLRDVGTAIKESGLKKLNFETIKKDILAFYESGEMDLTSYLLCEGTPPVPGPERQVEYAITFNPPETTEKITSRLVELLRETTGRADDPSTPDDAPRVNPEEIRLESLKDFPADEIQKTAFVKTEQLLCSIDPPTPGEPGVDVYGAIIPAEPGAVAEITLHENITQQKAVIATTRGGVLDYRESDGVVSLRVRPHQDARIQVELTEDRMEARLSLEEGAGTGTLLTREAIDQALAQARVTHGLDQEALSAALRAARASGAGAPLTQITVARGTDPVNQSENRVEHLVGGPSAAPVRIRKDGTADYRSRGDIITVEQGQELCRLLPSQQKAIDGTDVTGAPVPARKLGGFELEIGPNVSRREEADGSVTLCSEIRGELLATAKRIEVLSSHTVQGDVDMSVGNIRFPGAVTIGGTVRSGFFVVSTGDIKIAGGVEGALISSDGDIMIKGGVKGGGKAVLRSKRNILSPFVELATVLAVGDVVLKTALVRSRIKCNGKITFKGDKGRIVGGTLRARNGFEVASVGSPRGIRTKLSFGQDYLVADLIEKEEKEIEKVKRRITQVDLEMRKSEKTGATEALETLRAEKIKLLKLMEKRGLRLFTLRERFEQHFPSKVVISGEVHSGTVFESHGRTFEVTSPRKAIAVEFNPHTGNIDISELNGS
ncbi:flagellar assembly protein A [Alkalispirochaeta alkalica]|uniref:flagellar assembly protein A n=1 Tax=Alkalispirochaeta alkalica TaxID=46356 RepID=UPI0003775ABB|nr:flagellar assembly protein A [Alkalispirochaeta alkalica]